jgi:hypothetical protein
MKHRVHMENLNLKKISEVEGKVQYPVEISNRFSVFENLDAEENINRAWETFEKISKLQPKHKPWFEEGCSELLDQRKQAKLQWLQDRNLINGDNLSNIRRETSRRFRSKEKIYMKEKTDKLATNSKNMNIRHLHRGINECKRG